MYTYIYTHVCVYMYKYRGDRSCSWALYRYKHRGSVLFEYNKTQNIRHLTLMHCDNPRSRLDKSPDVKPRSAMEA